MSTSRSLSRRCEISSKTSTAHHLYLRGGLGVGSMIKAYGGRQRNAVCPAHFSVGSRTLFRKVLQALKCPEMGEKDPSGKDRLPQQTRKSDVYRAPSEEYMQGIQKRS